MVYNRLSLYTTGHIIVNCTTSYLKMFYCFVLLMPFDPMEYQESRLKIKTKNQFINVIIQT